MEGWGGGRGLGGPPPGTFRKLNPLSCNLGAFCGRFDNILEGNLLYSLCGFPINLRYGVVGVSSSCQGVWGSAPQDFCLKINPSFLQSGALCGSFDDIFKSYFLTIMIAKSGMSFK